MNLAVRAPRRLLDELAVLAGALAKAERALPEVELLLAGGQLVRGRLVDAGEDGGVAVALVAVDRGGVIFVRVDHIAAIGVCDAGVLVHPVTSDAPVPSRLELARQVAGRRDVLAVAVGHPISIEAAESTDDGRRAVHLALPLVCDVVAAIAGEPMGRDALAPITTLALASGTPDVRRDGTTLTVQISELVTGAFTAASLRAAIERVL